MKKSAGFSMVELMVVIAIIAIMSAIAIPQYFGMTQKVQDSEVALMLNGLQKEIVTFYAFNDRYPTFDEIGWSIAAADPWDMGLEQDHFLAGLLEGNAFAMTAPVLPDADSVNSAFSDSETVDSMYNAYNANLNLYVGNLQSIGIEISNIRVGTTPGNQIYTIIACTGGDCSAPFNSHAQSYTAIATLPLVHEICTFSLVGGQTSAMDCVKG